MLVVLVQFGIMKLLSKEGNRVGRDGPSLCRLLKVVTHFAALYLILQCDLRALDELNKLSAEANERVAKNAEAVKLIERTDKLTDYMFELDAKHSQFCALVDRVFFKQMKDINDLEELKLKAARNDVLKICLGTLVSVCAGGLLLSELASHF